MEVVTVAVAVKADAVRKRLERARKRVDELRGLVRHLEGEVERLEQARVAEYEQAFSSSDAAEIARHEREAEQLSAKIQAARNRADEARSQLTAAERVLKGLEDEYREARIAELVDLKEKVSKKRRELLESAADEIRRLIVSIYAKYQDLGSEWNELERELIQLEGTGRLPRTDGFDVSADTFFASVVRDTAHNLFLATEGERGYPLGLVRHNGRWGCQQGQAAAELWARRVGG